MATNVNFTRFTFVAIIVMVLGNRLGWLDALVKTET